MDQINSTKLAVTASSVYVEAGFETVTKSPPMEFYSLGCICL